MVIIQYYGYLLFINILLFLLSLFSIMVIITYYYSVLW